MPKSRSPLWSRAFRRSRAQASPMLAQPMKMRRLSAFVNQKVLDLMNRREASHEALDSAKTFARMVKAYADGSYRQVPWKTLTLIVTSLIYFASPVDMIPDYLPAVGLADDFAILLFTFKLAERDVADFRRWETRQRVPLDTES